MAFLLDPQIEIDGLGQGDRRQLFQLYDDVSLIHRWHEALAYERKGRSGQAEHCERAARNPARMSE